MPKSTEDLYKELLAQGQQYQQQANDLLSQYDSRGAFSYDPQNDPGFQALRNQYMHQGQRAMQDTMGQAAGLTGGYGSTYAQSAGNQAYNEYLTQLNAQVPALQQQARAAWDAEGQRMLDRYNLALNQANTAYGQGRDAMGDMRYEQEYADDMAYRQWQMQQAEQDRQDSLNKASQDRAYQMVMQMISTGQTPSAELLAQAGVSADYARSMANYYRQQAALAAASSSSGGGTRSTRTSNPGNTDTTSTPKTNDTGLEIGQGELNEILNKAANMGGDQGLAWLQREFNKRFPGNSYTNKEAAWNWLAMAFEQRRGRNGAAHGGTGNGRVAVNTIS